VHATLILLCGAGPLNLGLAAGLEDEGLRVLPAGCIADAITLLLLFRGFTLVGLAAGLFLAMGFAFSHAVIVKLASTKATYENFKSL